MYQQASIFMRSQSFAFKDVKHEHRRVECVESNN